VTYAKKKAERTLLLSLTEEDILFLNLRMEIHASEVGTILKNKNHGKLIMISHRG